MQRAGSATGRLSKSLFLVLPFRAFSNYAFGRVGAKKLQLLQSGFKKPEKGWAVSLKWFR